MVVGGGQCGLPQLRRSGLETMGILGGSDAMQQLFEEIAHASQESTISPFLISIGNELHRQGMRKASKEAVN